MATLQKLIDRTNYFVDDQMTQQKAIDLFNDCLEDISIDAKYEKETTGPIENNKINVPSDYLNMIQLMVEKNGYKEEARRASLKDEEWDLSGNYSGNIFFREFSGEFTITPGKEGATYILRYYSNLPEVSGEDLALEPPIQKPFHNLLPLYAATRYFENWESKDGQKEYYITQYMDLKNRFIEYNNKRSSRNKSNKVVMSRGWYD